MVLPESSLRWGVEIVGFGMICQASVHNRHEQLREGGCNCYAAVVVRESYIALALV